MDLDSSDFKSNESFFRKDSLDQKSGFGFVERNAKSVLRSKIRFWIYRKEHTLKMCTEVLALQALPCLLVCLGLLDCLGLLHLFGVLEVRGVFVCLGLIQCLAYFSYLAYLWYLAYFCVLGWRCLSVLAYFCVLAFFSYLAFLRYLAYFCVLGCVSVVSQAKTHNQPKTHK